MSRVGVSCLSVANRRARSEPVSSRSVEVFRRRVGSGLVGLLVTGDYAEHIWWFRKAEPPRWSGGSRAGLETRASWRADSPARASTSAVAKTTERRQGARSALLSDRRRVGTPPQGTTRLRSQSDRIGAGHQSAVHLRRTPPRHPPRGPPKIRQCRSQVASAEHFGSSRACDGVVALTKASVQLACHSRTCD